MQKIKFIFNFFFEIFFFNCYLTAPLPTLGHYRGGSLTHPMLISLLHFRPEDHQEPHNDVGSLSPTDCLLGFEPGTFRLLLQRLNPLGHIANLLLWELWECLTIPIKILLSICSNLLCLSACKKSTSSLNSSLRYCKEIANLSFWVTWACPATHT